MTDLAPLDADLKRLGPLVSFGWSTQQQFALASNTDIIVVIGGNRSGKTSVGNGILSRVVRREGPLYRRLLNSAEPADKRPLRIWVAPQTLEKFKSNWEHRLLYETFAGMEFDYTQSPFPVIRWHDAITNNLRLPPNEIWAKSQDAGFRSFESDMVDVVLFDEEPVDPRLMTSAKQRGATNSGVILLTFTPLLGMSWSYTQLYQPTVKDAFKVADRVWRRGRSITLIQMGMADNPAAVEGGGVDRLRDDPAMTEAEKRTRLYGEYGYTEGLLFPGMAGVTTESDDLHLLDTLPTTPLSWVLAADPNKAHGATLIGLDPFGNYVLVDEHYADSLPDSQHAAAYYALLEKWGISLADVLCVADPGGAGAQAILNMAEFDLPFVAVKKDAGSVAASIQLLRRLLWADPSHVHPLTGKLGAPRFYILRSIRSTWKEDGVEHHECRFLYEMRQYRQKPNSPPDTPIKERDHCLVGDTMVETTKGAVPIAGLVGQSGDVVTPWGKYRFHSVRPTHGGVPQSCVRLTFADGRSLTCTASHPVLSDGGIWVRAGELEPGDNVMDISHGVHYFNGHGKSHCSLRDVAGVSGQAMHPHQGRLLPFVSVVASPEGLGDGERADSRGASHPSPGSRQGAQRFVELGVYRGEGAPATAPSESRVSGEDGRHNTEQPRSDIAVGREMARKPRGGRVALSSGQKAMASAQAPFLDVPAVREAIHRHNAKTSALLREQLQVGVATEGGTGQCDQDLSRLCPPVHGEPLRQSGQLLPFVWRSAPLAVTHREEVPPQIVYNLDVDSAHSFAVNGGLVVHNCIDPARYTLLSRPWAPQPEDVETTERQKALAKLDPLSKRMDAEFEELVAKSNRTKGRLKGIDFNRR